MTVLPHQSYTPARSRMWPHSISNEYFRGKANCFDGSCWDPVTNLNAKLIGYVKRADILHW